MTQENQSADLMNHLSDHITELKKSIDSIKVNFDERFHAVSKQVDWLTEKMIVVEECWSQKDGRPDKNATDISAILNKMTELDRTLLSKFPEYLYDVDTLKTKVECLPDIGLRLKHLETKVSESSKPVDDLKQQVCKSETHFQGEIEKLKLELTYCDTRHDKNFFKLNSTISEIKGSADREFGMLPKKFGFLTDKFNDVNRNVDNLGSQIYKRINDDNAKYDELLTESLRQFGETMSKIESGQQDIDANYGLNLKLLNELQEDLQLLWGKVEKLTVSLSKLN